MGFKYQLQALNFDNLKKEDTHSHLSDLCDTFSLSNLVNGVTCVKSQNGTSICSQIGEEVFTIPV